LPDRLRHRALGYIRVSSYLGRDREDSLTEPLQLEKIQQWCAADLDLVDVLRDACRASAATSTRPSESRVTARAACWSGATATLAVTPPRLSDKPLLATARHL
jgi:hypothetical protein